MPTDATHNFQLLPDEVLDTFPNPIRMYAYSLHTVIQQQQEEILLLKARVAELEARLVKNSSNSGKPPSSDGLGKKTKSQRNKSDKKQGAQQGHVGKGRSQIENPDIVVNHAPTSCEGCGCKLDQVEGACVEKRQVFEIPQPKIEVTEHRLEEKQCPCCGQHNRGTFPEDVKGPVQFGARVQALVMLNKDISLLKWYYRSKKRIVKSLIRVLLTMRICLHYPRVSEVNKNKEREKTS